jgi:predicted AlkP superfamily phosphohydrolase/phosphomutase
MEGTSGLARSRVIAIGLDACELSLLLRLVDRSVLPEIARILAEGQLAETSTIGHHLAEVPWTEMLTGCTPETTGYWSPIAYRPDYTLHEVASYDFAECRPFYAYCGGRRVIALDIPQTRLCDDVAGAQILGWGSHSQNGPSLSRPAGLLAEMTARHGGHPAFPWDWMMVGETRDKAARLEAAFHVGLERRTRICLDLMARIDWDLVFVVLGEIHAAGHDFWHLAQPDHPLADHPLAESGRDGSDDPIERLLRTADRAIGRIRAAAPLDTKIVLFSERGMKANAADLASLVFLPELLYRFCFGEPAMAPGRLGEPPPPHPKSRGDWGLLLWAGQEDGNWLRRAVRRHARAGLSRRFDRAFGSGLRLRHPFDAPLGYMPPVWFQPYWPHMPAFALPSLSDGFIRINLRGRESWGVVAPDDYGRVCARIEAMLRALRDPRRGTPVVAEILRLRRTGAEALAAASDEPAADLVVKWRDRPADVVDSPEFGRIGPLPFRRSGDHTPRGFCALAGTDRNLGRRGRLVDVAPTILDLLDIAAPAHFDGVSLLAPARLGAAIIRR